MTTTVLITGATSGIGLALAKHYADLGWQVLACGRRKDALDNLAKQYTQLYPFCFDQTEPAQVSEFASRISRVDLVILNAGTCEYVDDLPHFDAALFARVINTNLVSIGYLLQAILPKLAASTASDKRLAFVSSSVTLLPFPRAEAYGASKAGLDYLANTLRLTLQPLDIAVSLIQPGFVDTPLTAKNNFAMPGQISSEQAAKTIVTQLARGKDHIIFPRRFTHWLRLLAVLPRFIWQALAGKMVKA